MTPVERGMIAAAVLMIGVWYIKAGDTFTSRLIRTTVVCLIVGLLVAAWF